MNPKRLHQHWQASLETRVDAIRKLLYKHHPLSTAEVHDLRVALRRARLLAGLGPRLMGKMKAKSFRDTTHALLALLDPVRDCDVALDWLREVKSSPGLVAKLLQQEAAHLGVEALSAGAAAPSAVAEHSAVVEHLAAAAAPSAGVVGLSAADSRLLAAVTMPAECRWADQPAWAAAARRSRRVA